MVYQSQNFPLLLITRRRIKHTYDEINVRKPQEYQWVIERQVPVYGYKKENEQK